MEKQNFSTPPRAKMTGKGLSIPPTPFLNCLGVGTGVNVWSFNNPAASPWAVKNVRRAMEKNKQDSYQHLIDKEAKVLADIKHENIVGFRALLKSVDGRHCLAMESCGRSLGNMVEDREENCLGPFGHKQILKVLYNIAKALDYLHTEKKLLHGDIKSYNILVKDNFGVIKLCDLGVCVRMDENGVLREDEEYTGTLIYNAPEVVDPEANPHKITGKAEIFSLGLVMWEMLSLRPPYCEGLEDSMATSLDDSQLSMESSAGSTLFPEGVLGSRPALPEGLGKEYSDVIELFDLCTEAVPEERPTAASLVEYVEIDGLL